MTETSAATAVDDDLDITELVEFSPDRYDAVKTGATGIPFLIMKAAAEPEPAAEEPDEPELAGDAPPSWLPAAKSLARLGAAGLSLEATERLWKAIAADGTVDEAPDIDGGKKVLSMIGGLIVSEAQELAAGHFEETMDIALLLEAMSALKCWLSIERANAMHAADDAACGGCGVCPSCYGTVMCSAAEKALLSAKERNDLPDSAFAHIEDGGQKDAGGKTTPRSKRHFPIHDKAHADAAMSRIEGGAAFGDQAKRKVKAAQKKFGEDGAGKSAAPVVAEGATEVQTDHDAQLDELVAAKVAKALEAREESDTALRGELAKAQAKADAAEATVKEWSKRPVTGGPVMSVTRAPSAGAPDGTDWTAKAAYYRSVADQMSNPADADNYRQLARQADEKATSAAPAAG